MVNKPIHITFCANDAYLRYLYVPIMGMLANNKESHIIVHIISDYISDRNRRSIIDYFSVYSVEIKIHLIDDALIQSLKFSKFSKYAWYRIFIPQILSDINKVLYLDADIAVNGDISTLFDLDLDGYSVAGVLDDLHHDHSLYRQADIEYDGKYICSGVLLMNLDYWRKHDIASNIISWAKSHQDLIVYPDQDSINHVCFDSKILLHLRYGISTNLLTSDFVYQKHRDQIIECLDNPTIIHYNIISPWFMECKHPLLEIWDYYNIKLGEHRVRLKYKYQQSPIQRLKTAIWYRLHSSIKRNQKGWDEMEELMHKHGISLSTIQLPFK